MEFRAEECHGGHRFESSAPRLRALRSGGLSDADGREGQSVDGELRLRRLIRWRVRATSAGAPQLLLLAGFAIEYVIDRVLCLGCCVDQKLALIAKLLQPTGNVGGLIMNDRI